MVGTRGGRPDSSGFWRRGWGSGLLTIAAYLAAAIWAREISLPGSVLIWFPPAGVAIVATFFRPRLVVAVAIADALSTWIVMGRGDDFGPLGLAANSIGLALAYALGGWLLRRLAVDPRLRTAEDLAMVGIAVAIAGAAATVVGIGVQVSVDLVDRGEITRSAGVFWVGDLVGAACTLPALLIYGHALAERRAPQLADHEDRYPIPLLLAELLLPALVALVLMDVGQRPMRFVYLAFIPVVVVAVRHGVNAAAASTAALSAVMTAGAHAQLETTLARSDFQLLMFVLTVTGVVTGAVVSSRRDVARAKDRVTEIVEATPDIVASASRDGSIRYLNPVGRQLLGFADTGLPATPAFDFLPDELARDLMRQGMRVAEQEGTWTGDNRLRRPDGHIFPVSQVLVAHPLWPEDEQALYSTICRDMTAQHALEDQLARAVLYDEATGLPNRTLLMEQMSRLLASAPPATCFAALITDLDHLQRVNQTFGFPVGEEVVVTISHRLAGLVRSQDVIARHGGSQFVLVLADIPDEMEVVALAERVLSCFTEPVPADGHELHVTGSVGITLAHGGDDHIETLRSAEIALHRAKEAGGGRFTLFDEALEERTRRRLEIEDDLHEVLTTETWTLAYQPIFDAVERRVVSVEALLRWTHPERGPVAPLELVQLAETSGTIVRLGREIFRRACQDTCTWLAMGADVTVSINVSARQLREPSFVDDVSDVIDETGIAPDRVVVELTETLLATELGGEIDTLHRLRTLGCQVALDDFGTGYSSLSELRNLPIDVVKLDQSFITDLTSSPRALALVESVVRLAHALELTVVAEGVEEDAQIDALTALGCHRVQGFALARPVAAEVITGMLSDARDLVDPEPLAPR